MKQQFLKNTAETFQAYIYENNRKLIASSALLTVFWPGSEKKFIDNVPMTVGADGLLSYALSAAENSSAQVNYRAVISYVHNAGTFATTFFYDVVNSRLTGVVTDDDVTAELPQLRDNGSRVRGTAQGGSSSTIVDAGLSIYADDYFTGGLAESLDKDETREITGFVSSTGTVQTMPFSGDVASGERYVLTRSYTREIKRAFEKIEERLIRLGKRPQLILDPYDLREAHIYYSVAEVCKGMATDAESFWWMVWREYEKKGDDAFNSINFKYDESGDGYISGAEEDATTTGMRTVRG